MRAQRKGSVFILCILFAFGIDTGTSNVFAQGSGTAGSSEIDNVKKQMLQMEEQLRMLRQKVEELEAKPLVAPRTPVASEEKMRQLEQKVDAALAGTKKTFPSQFNPSLTLSVDTIASYKSRSQTFNLGDGSGGPQDANSGGANAVNNPRPAGADFNLRSAELFISADVDPFARAYAVIVGSADAAGNDEAMLAVEEAALITTRLPYNLTVRGGRFFANFGTLSYRHDHDLPFVDRPPSLDTFVGGESQTNGVEVSWLAPTPFYLRVTGAVGNKFGGDTIDPVTTTGSRPIKGLTYIGRLQTYFDITDDHNVELGTSVAETPNADDGDPRVPTAPIGRFERRLVGLDFKYRWYPLGRGLRQSLTVAGELLHDVGEAVGGGGRRVDIFGNPVRQGAWGGYVYAEYRLSKQWRPGFRFDYFQEISEPGLVTGTATAATGRFGSTRNETGHRTDNRTWSPYLTWMPSEFQRLRLQYNRSDRGNARSADEFFLQWTVALGSHTHGFSERD